MPVLAVRPDGTKLFMAWYDRRADTNNGLMEVYGRWGTIETSGVVTLGSEFKISTVRFPPVFTGTLSGNTIEGHYDPVYPAQVNLHWWYSEWPEDPLIVADPVYVNHVGEYNGSPADNEYAYLTWADGRDVHSGIFPRNQSDIRFIKLIWPEP